MKKSLFLFASIFALYSCQNKEEKLIIEHLQQDRIYDFEIIKSFPTDSLKTEWKPDNNTIRNLDELKRCVREINASGYNNIKITTDADYHIKSLEKIKDDKKLASDVKSGCNFGMNLNITKILFTNLKRILSLNSLDGKKYALLILTANAQALNSNSIKVEIKL